MTFNEALNIIDDITIKENTLDDIELKKALIETHFVDLVNKITRTAYLFAYDKKDAVFPFKKDEYERLSLLMCQCTPKSYKIAYSFNRAKSKRRKRLQDHISDMINSTLNTYFVTLTFNDEALQTSVETRRKYVRRTLKNISPYFVANIDYGRKKEREHYHAVICSSEKPNLKIWAEKYGFYDIKKVGHKEKDACKTAKYITKLTSHAVKKSTKAQNRCIFSKALKELYLYEKPKTTEELGYELFGDDLIII